MSGGGLPVGLEVDATIFHPLFKGAGVQMSMVGEPGSKLLNLTMDHD